MNRALILFTIGALFLIYKARGVECSWERFQDDGRLMAAGGRFNALGMTCATWLYPVGTRLIVTDTHNGSSVTVTVTDRPARRFPNRIDLSPAAFQKLNGLQLGLCEVKVEVLKTHP